MQAAEPAGFPLPSRSGFHHCALIYDSPVRGVRELTPYVIRTLADGSIRPGEWLFDAYLFLIFTTPDGVRTDSGATRMADWQHCLDRWFTADRDLAALDEAIDRAAQVSGASPAPRNVILTIPYLNRDVHEFGAVGPSDRNADLSTPAGQEAAITWYRNAATQRFAAAHYRHLRLWGFYWMAEGVAEKDEPTVRIVADSIHANGLRFLWIPWFDAPGWRHWKLLGFDTAIMQPNYAFKSSTHKGRVRRNRLAINAMQAREAGMGVEMEAGAILTSAMDRQPFLHYLVDGAPDRWGYQQGAMAYYLETRLVEDACSSNLPDHRVWYDRLADFVAGTTVADPQGIIAASPRAEAGTLVLSGRFPAPRALGGMDLLMDEPPGTQPWAGTAEVRTRADRNAPFVTGGWAARTGADARDGRWQVVSVPLDTNALDFEIVLKADAGSHLPKPETVQPDPIDRDELLRHAALGARYDLVPLPEAAYGDTPGRLLTDGHVPQGWGKGRTIGWLGSRVQATVSIDLGREFAIERVEVHGPGGGTASVNFPSRTAVMISSDRAAPAEAAGIGSMPRDLRVGACGPLSIDRRRAANDADGHVPATFPPDSRGRYVTVVQQGPGSWLMLSEIRVFSGGTNVAVSAPYTLYPPPTPASMASARKRDDSPRYPDDGVRLTDGIVAPSFVPGQVTGWHGQETHAITVDLGKAIPVRQVRIWVLRGGRAGIFAPGKVTAALSSDGSSWSPAISATTLNSSPEDGSKSEAVACEASFPPGTSAQQLRVDFAPGRGWTMVSEIEVRATD